MAAFSLDAIAKAADVTRLTVYNQFGSRRGLLEAVFDDIARRGRLHRLNDAMAESDPSCRTVSSGRCKGGVYFESRRLSTIAASVW
jgi:AcrR family transcriptional regulator